MVSRDAQLKMWAAAQRERRLGQVPGAAALTGPGPGEEPPPPSAPPFVWRMPVSPRPWPVRLCVPSQFMRGGALPGVASEPHRDRFL